MKIRRTSAAIAVAATGALLFTACTSPAGTDDPEPGETTTAEGEDEITDPCKVDSGITETAEGNISYSVGEDEWLGINGDTPETYSVYNSVVNGRVESAFVYFGVDGTVCENTEFGTLEVLSEDPLQVEYTVNDDAVWSDGEPVQYADYLLAWATQKYTVDGGEDALFNYVGGLELSEFVPEPPTGANGDKSFVYDYETVNADWKIQVTTAKPAHVVAEQIGVTLDELVVALQEGDYEILEPAAEFWNEGWLSPVPGELPDPSIAVVNGPYTFKENGWTAGQSLTLEANEAYWGTPPGTDELTFRFSAADTHVQALQNGDLDVIEPQATVDTLGQLDAIGDTVSVALGDTLTWEHLDFNFAEGNVFADNLALREAFALCVPRQQIVDNLIVPVNPEAVVMNAREVFPFQDTYDEVVEASYDGRYDQVDLDAAIAKFEESGAEEGTQVRIGYSAPNPRRTNEVEFIKSSCDQVGFEIVDVGDPDFFSVTLPAGDYEVALFAWAGSGQIASGRNIYSTTGGQNYGQFSSDAVDEAWQVLASTVDPNIHLEQVKVIEKLLWDELFGIPVFAHPGVAAYSSSLEGLRKTATQDQIVWNAEQWVRAS
ncbi:ABC transporter substrate-binding protein [Oerskovia flava]|uniref:ABC transporter substrate-binding protein n=1 Tax=Oerskovia flava TaxID=2986422 RepID=UPI00224032AA|nr:ABC transporter substrate-binding protein [Oerskovia sp. JB1-3-2]